MTGWAGVLPPKPYTIYTGAILWDRAGKLILSNPIEVVSGDNPLTEDEIKGRFRRICADAWKTEEHGPISEYTILGGGFLIRRLVIS